MRINFKELSIKNFMSWERKVIRFDDLHSAVLVTGDNGHGKSALIEALVWCLFGKPSRRIKIDEVCNRENKKDCCVGVTLELNGKSYFIERFRNDRKWNNQLHFYRDGDDLTCDRIQDTQDLLEEELGVTYDTFPPIFYLYRGYGKYFTELTDKEKKDFLIDSWDFQIFYACRDVVRKQLRDAEKDVERKEARLSALQLSLEERNEDLKAARTEMESKKKNKRIAVRELKRTIAQNKKEVDSVNDKVVQAKKTRDSFSTLADQCGEELAALRSKLADVRDVVEAGETCPTCQQEIAEEHRKAMEGEKHALERKVKVAQKKRNDAQSEVQRTVEQFNKYRDRKVQLQTEIAAAESRLAEAEEEKPNDYGGILKRIEEQKKTYEKQIKDLQLTTSSATLLSEQLNLFQTVFGSKGVLSYSLDRYFSPISAGFRSYMELLHSGVDVSMRIDDDKVCIDYGGGRSYGSMSLGEAARVNLALNMSLRDMSETMNGVSTNLVVVDELDLDFEGVEAIVGVLNSHYATKGVVPLVLSYREEIQKCFDQVWEVKKDTFSQLEVV